MKVERFGAPLLSILIIVPLMASAMMLLSVGSASAEWPDYIIVQGSDTSYSQEKYTPAPSKPYEPGDMPPIMAAKKVDPAGAVVIAGIGRTCNGGTTYGNQRWESGELDVLLDKAFQWMVPGATKVLWYADSGVSLGQYEYAYNDASNCSWLIDALEDLGYVVEDTDDSTFTPITSSLLEDYDILILPGLQLGDGSPDGGDPDLLPDDVVTTITDFVKTPPGKGLFLMESGDYDSYCFHRVQNKILEALEFGVYYQHDTVGDPETANNDSLKYVEVDVTANQFGLDYQEATGKTTIRLYKVPSLSVPGPGVVVEITPKYQASTPGSTLTFSVTVTNIDAVDDSYILTVSDDAGWGLALEDESLMDVPGPGKSKQTTLTVTIASGAAIGAEDNIRVKAESVVKAGVSDTGNCIVRAAMQVIPPIDDTQVVEGSPDTNYGGKDFMYMGSSTTGSYLDERVFLKFDLTGIPSIISPGDWVAADLHARLHVYCFIMTGTLGKDVKVRSVDNDSWDEAEITWNDYPAYGGVLDTRAVTEVGWHSWDVTSHVQNQFTGDKIASFCMTAESDDLGYPDNFSYGFNTKEADVILWPYLEFILPYEVDVSIKPWIQDSSPGGTLTYTVIVTNEGSEADSYSLSVTDTQGWGPAIAQTQSTNLQNGESWATTLTVTIPSDASPCTKDTMTITATSQADSTVSDSANGIAHAFEGVKLLPTDDAHVSSGNVHAKYGGEDTIYLRSDTVDFKNERIFLKFDLSTVPSGSTITEAEVWLWSQKAEFADINAQCWSVTDDVFVDEDTVTWGTQPELVELLDTVALKYLPPSEDMWLLWNATQFVRDEFAGDKTASFGIKAEVEDTSGRYRFSSREWPAENERPRLKITYTTIPSPAGVDVSVSPGDRSGSPGATLTFTVTVVNEGEAQDTYDLTVTDTWGATVSPTSLTITTGGSDTATVSVTIPEGTAIGTEDEITVKAISRADSTVSDIATCTARASEKGEGLPITLIAIVVVVVVVVVVVALMFLRGRGAAPTWTG